MIRRKMLLMAPLALLIACNAETPGPVDPTGAPALFSKTAKGGRAAATGVVYVRSQGLYYDTFVSTETLPMQGRFQKIEDGETDFGPGDQGYLGGRWWEDVNGDGIQNEGDHFFHCPLFPPGRTEP